MASLVDYGNSDDDEEEPTPTPPPFHSLPQHSLPHSPPSPSGPSPSPRQLILNEEGLGGRGSPYTEEIINKITEEMEHVVSVNSWAPHASPNLSYPHPHVHPHLGSRGMERVRYNLF
jgi:hypothetical protein